jgi:flagellar biosynthesis protein
MTDKNMSDDKKVIKAAALEYQVDEDSAPKVTASGRGEIAERIMEIAISEGITLYQDQEFVEILLALDIGTEIPPELYQAAADALSFVYGIQRDMSQSS